MKPLKLQFKGINSFSENTVIDFENLTRSGIFGIFGDTGSGKSTILDCINFALYGRVERSREKADIINYRSEAAEVRFDFDVHQEGARRAYSIERSIKKKSGIHKAALYEDGACIADNASTVTKKITDILGVDAEDFRKCIALPQGEFAQFVKSQPSERIALIERLFSLSKYGDRLKERLKARGDEAYITLQTLNAKLQLYAEYSSEALKEQKESIKECEKNISALQKRLDAEEKDLRKIKEIRDCFFELEAISSQLKELEIKKPQIEKLRVGLNAVPACKTAIELDGEIAQKSQRLVKSVEAVRALQNKISAAEREASALKVRAEKEDYDKKIAGCIDLAAKHATCAGKPQKLKELEIKLEAMRADFRKKEEELSSLTGNYEDCVNGVKLAARQLDGCGKDNIEQIINTDFKGAVLKQEYVNSLDYFVSLNANVRLFDNDTALYGYISDEIKQRISDYKDRVYQVKDFNMQSAEQKLKNFLLGDERRKQLTDALNEKKSAQKDSETAVRVCRKDLQTIASDGEKLKARYDEIKSELVSIFGADVKDYAAAVKANAEDKEKFERERRRTAEKATAVENTLKRLSSDLAAAKAEGAALSAVIDGLKQKLAVTLVSTGFTEVESCRKTVAQFNSFSDAEKALKEYDDSIISLNSRKAQLSKTEGINAFSESAYKEIEAKKTDTESALSSERERLAVLRNSHKTAEEKYGEKQALLKEHGIAEKQNNLIAQLKELTKGNKLMEYIANEYLYDICSLASVTLLNLTDGRYFLTYTDTFYAGDNFDCGSLRGVNTLSGGETFLVSLSLALALSQTICASLKPIEFFFLDEGFGTLDGTLVDTVMNALEKLKNSRFTIGVISHVEELKHRIDSKIIVNKATEHRGSTVQVSC